MAAIKNWGDSQDDHPPVFSKLQSSIAPILAVPPTCEQFLGELGAMLHNTLTPEECKAIISASEEMGYQAAEDYCYLYRDRWNDRFMSDDPQLADLLWERVKQFVPKQIKNPFSRDGKSHTWEVDKLNVRFRFCKYTGGRGHHFGAHTDGVYRVDNDHMSLLTCMFYLNGSDEFEGGCTNFIEYKTNKLNYSVKPAPGLCVIFRQNNLDCYHLGTEVTKGIKYIMRTDIMYHTI